MAEIWTQADSDNLADIIWWIKGYIAGARENLEECPFTYSHIEGLRKARSMLFDKKVDSRPFMGVDK